MQPHPFAYQTLDSISNDRVSHFLGDRDSEPPDQVGARSSGCERQQVASVEFLTSRLDEKVVGTTTKPHLLGDSRRSAAGHHFLAIVTEIRLRPLARRRRSTSRPPRVFLRARNPWVR